MKCIQDININKKNKVYLELSLKIRNIKKKKLPLLIKINSHPCAGKTTFIKCYSEFYNSCKLYDFDSFPEGKEKCSGMLLKKKCNSILFGCSGGGLVRPYDRGNDYDIHENVIYIFIFPKLEKLYQHIVQRQLKKKVIKETSWAHPKRILQYRNNMYSLIFKDQVQLRPLFYSFEEGINYCIKEYNE